MTYLNWQKAVRRLVARDDRLSARVWNLFNETRIPRPLRTFRLELGRVHRVAIVRGANAADALEESCRVLRDPTCRWLRHLAVPAGAALPGHMHTHLPARDIKRYYVGGRPLDLRKPRPRIALSPSLGMTSTGGPALAFIWVTFEPAGAAPTDDPNRVKRELGLDRYADDDFVYRVVLQTAGKALHIPTCLDARLSEAWAPPPAGHTDPWGVTRDLVTGAPLKPELLSDPVNHAGERHIAELVSPPGAPRTVGPVPSNFMVGRA